MTDEWLFLAGGTIDAASLHTASGLTQAVLLEIRSHPSDPLAPPAETVAVGAIPVYWKDLLWEDNTRDFPGRTMLDLRLQALGVAAGALIAVYGEHHQYGFYARWALRLAGIAHVVVLEDPGGVRRPLAQTAALGGLPTGHAPLPRRALKADVLRGLSDSATQIVDARSREEYEGYRVSPPGTPDHGAERAGHIPGAVNLHFGLFLDGRGRLKPQAELQAIAAQAGLDAGRPVIAYCRLSHRASLVTYVLQERLGFSDVRLYDGSWTEWGSSVGTPIHHHRPPQAAAAPKAAAALTH